MAWAGVDLASLGPRVLFGLRASQLVDPGMFTNGLAFRRSFSIVETTPDHFNLRCVLGVWNVEERSFWAAPGSTVCNVVYMFGQAEAQQRDVLCNMLPAGVYAYRIGTHRNGTNSRLPGAFRLTSAVSVLRRYRHPLGFTTSDTWDFRGPEVADNIHCAYGAREGMPRYSSAGCQVISGSIDSATHTRHTGLWREFRVAAGLAADPQLSADPDNPRMVRSSEDGRSYAYVLLASRELRMAAENPNIAGNDLEFIKLRRGTRGDKVVALQRRIGTINLTGEFDAATQRAVIQRQRVRLGSADGVITRSGLVDLGLAKLW